MKKSVFLLAKDYSLLDSITKRFLIETNIELNGTGTDTSTAFVDIQRIKPDILVFEYPMNFTAKQLSEAMQTVNPNIILIGLVTDTNNQLGINNELRQSNVNYVYNSPFDLENLMETLRKVSGTSTAINNPFSSATASTTQNPFIAQNIVNKAEIKNDPFSNSNINSNNSIFNNGNQPIKNYSNGENINFNIDNFQEQQNGLQINNNLQTFKTMRQKLIAIHCPKGGVGKTSISTNLATLLSTIKVGNKPLNVLLVDMDWDFGDICVNMGKQPTPNIMAWVNDIKKRRALNPNVNMDFTQAQIEKYLITYEKTGLKILAAPSSHNDGLDIPNDAAKIVLDNLKNNCDFDVIIFDCGNNTNTHTLQTLLAVHSVYEVITMDVSAMNELSLLMSTLKSISFPINKIKLIVNKLPKNDREWQMDDISNALGLKIVSIIPDNEKVRVHNNNGEPLVLGKNSNTFTEALKQTANVVLENNLFNRKGNNNNNNKNNSNKSFFSKLFGR